MKIKITSFIFLMAFVVTAVHCSRPSNEFSDTPDTPKKPSLFLELKGQYHSDDGQKLKLNVLSYALYIKNERKESGTYDYDTNASSEIELDLENGSMIFKIERDSNGQIVRLIQTSSGIVFHRRVTDEEEKEEEKEENKEDKEDINSYNGLDVDFMKKYTNGRYIGTINGKYMLLELDNNHLSFYIFRDHKEYQGRYDIEVTKSGFLLLLHFSNESKTEIETETYNVDFYTKKITSVTSNIQEELVKNDSDSRDLSLLNLSSGQYPYTVEQINLLLENLKGQYQGTIYDKEVVFDVVNNVSMNIFVHDKKLTYQYRAFILESDFFTINPLYTRWYTKTPSLIFEMEAYTVQKIQNPYWTPTVKYVPLGEFDMNPMNPDKKVFQYEIVFAPNSRIEVIGLNLIYPNKNTPKSYLSKVKK